MHEISPRVANLSLHVHGLHAKMESVQDQLKLHRGQMAQWEDRKAHYLKCNATLDKLIQVISEQGVGRVETVITEGLQTVFGPDISCFLERRDMAKGTTYSIKIKVQTEKGEVVGDPMESFGGGPVNLISFLFRVLMIHRFNLSKLLLLDEGFNNVSRDRLDAVSTLLKVLAEDHGYSILAITHQSEMSSKADRVYRVGGVIGDPTLTLLSVGDEA